MPLAQRTLPVLALQRRRESKVRRPCPSCQARTSDHSMSSSQPSEPRQGRPVPLAQRMLLVLALQRRRKSKVQQTCPSCLARTSDHSMSSSEPAPAQRTATELQLLQPVPLARRTLPVPARQPRQELKLRRPCPSCRVPRIGHSMSSSEPAPVQQTATKQRLAQQTLPVPARQHMRESKTQRPCPSCQVPRTGHSMSSSQPLPVQRTATEQPVQLA